MSRAAPCPAPSRRRFAPAALLAAALLSGCPLPQALPEYPTTGRIAPPRILVDAVTPNDTVTVVSPGCAPGTEPSFTLHASLDYDDTLVSVEARWFVDYAPGRATQVPYGAPEIIPGPSGNTTVRPVKDFVFAPYAFDDQAFRDAGGLHVVELVVSNGFAPEPATPSHALPYRTPAAPSPNQTFETQVYRWVFHYAASGTCLTP